MSDEGQSIGKMAKAFLKSRGELPNTLPRDAILFLDGLRHSSGKAILYTDSQTGTYAPTDGNTLGIPRCETATLKWIGSEDELPIHRWVWDGKLNFHYSLPV